MVQEIIDEVDTNHDGKISFQEFEEGMKKMLIKAYNNETKT